MEPIPAVSEWPTQQQRRSRWFFTTRWTNVQGIDKVGPQVCTISRWIHCSRNPAVENRDKGHRGPAMLASLDVEDGNCRFIR